MRLTIFLAAGILCLPASAFAQAWMQYSYPDQGFAIQLPDQPAITTANVTTPAEIAGPAKVYSLNSGAAVYTLRVIDLSNSSVTDMNAIQAAERDLSSQGSVRQALDERINQQMGRELSVDKPDGGKLIAAIFYANHHLYELTASANGPAAQAESNSLVRFQQSLTFIGQNGGRGGRGGRGGFGGGPFGGVGNPQTVAACSGKSAGDKVQLTTPQGTIAATCTLVARPDQPPGRGNGRNGNNPPPAGTPN